MSAGSSAVDIGKDPANLLITASGFAVGSTSIAMNVANSPLKATDES